MPLKPQKKPNNVAHNLELLKNIKMSIEIFWPTTCLVAKQSTQSESPKKIKKKNAELIKIMN